MFFSETNSQAHSPLIHTPIVILFTSPNHALSVALQHSCLPLLFFNDCHHTTLSSFLHRLFGWIFGWILGWLLFTIEKGKRMSVGRK
jgi:hypothetical protein